MTSPGYDRAMQYAAAWEAGEPLLARAPCLGVRLLTIPELAELPEVRWLVEGILPAGGDAMLYGKPGTFKSLLAVDLACAVAAGRSWHGRSTHQAPVVYIAGEGRHGLKARFEAHQDYHGLGDSGELFIVPEPLSLLLPANADALLDSLALRLPAGAAEEPLLLIVDTIRKCTPGGDENDSRTINDAMAFHNRLRREYPLLTVLMLHHPGTKGVRPRGSSAWEADTDAVFKADRRGKDMGVTLKCEKQRDSEPFADLFFEVSEHGEGLVLSGGVEYRDPQTLTPGERRILQALADQRSASVSWTRWREAAGVSESVLSRARKRFLAIAYVQQEDLSRPSGYSITTEGVAALRDFHTSSDFHRASREVLPSPPGGPKGPWVEVGTTPTGPSDTGT